MDSSTRDDQSSSRISGGGFDAPPAGPGVSPHQRNLASTREMPEDVGAWIARAATAPTTEERIFCLSQVSRLAPAHPQGKEEMHRTLWNELRRDPFLGYLEETDDIYYVRNKEFTSLAISKDRESKELFPPEKPTEIQRAHIRLGWAIAGLALSGLGTLVFAPLAIRSALRALKQPDVRRDRARAWIVITLAAILIPIALGLAWLLVIHF